MKNFKSLKVIKNLSDFYKVGDKLGQGSFGTVYKGSRLSHSQECAIKCIAKQSLRSNPVLPLLMKNELSILKNCAHTNIMYTVELLEDSKNFYVVSELLPGGELQDRMEKVGSYSEKDGAHIIRQILLALNYMHKQNMVHRDLKPENILLESADPDCLEIKVADFGFSCIFNPKEKLNLCLGSPLYMAPEVVKEDEYDEKVDIWGIGVMTYYIMSGVQPFDGRTR